jgi:hypothetical protein
MFRRVREVRGKQRLAMSAEARRVVKSKQINAKATCFKIGRRERKAEIGLRCSSGKELELHKCIADYILKQMILRIVLPAQRDFLYRPTATPASAAELGIVLTALRILFIHVTAPTCKSRYYWLYLYPIS